MPITEYKTVADYAKAQDSGARTQTRRSGGRVINTTIRRSNNGKTTHQLRAARKDDAEDAAGDGALPARRHAASRKLGRARTRAKPASGSSPTSWNNIFRNGVLDHAIKELCRLYVSRSVQCEYCGNQRSVKSTVSGALIEDHVLDLLNFEKSDHLQRAPEGRARLCRGDHLASRHR